MEKAEIKNRNGRFVLVIGEQEIPLERNDLHRLIAEANTALWTSVVMVPRIKLG
jgi:hypothetical protein